LKSEEARPPILLLPDLHYGFLQAADLA
jgi:hypothetical protein